MLKNTVEYKRFVWEFNNIINCNKCYDKIIFLCIGTNKIVGDAFGPVVGSVLKRFFQNDKSILVMGDLQNTITYEHIPEKQIYINDNYRTSLIIVLDSALSEIQNFGKIIIQNRGLKYAESLKKKNNTIGDISIKATVGVNTNDSLINFNNLENASIENLELMAKIVSNGIIDVMYKRKNNGKNIYKYIS